MMHINGAAHLTKKTSQDDVNLRLASKFMAKNIENYTKKTEYTSWM